ncbi:MAG: acyltransferase, partial [Chitinophagaceae bacterium]
MKTGKVYFPNLNAIRFIAAFMVVFHHIEQFKLLYKIPANFNQNSPFYLMGKLGVVLFFVLSGFLITFLLLKEESVTGKISIRDFYIRRVLKIWPLYFLIFAIGLYLLPNIHFLTVEGYGVAQVQENLLLKTILFVLFLPN